jgi:hypothetical protein
MIRTKTAIADVNERAVQDSVDNADLRDVGDFDDLLLYCATKQ